MNSLFSRLKLSSLQLIIAGFLIVILTGTLLLMLPASSKAGVWTSFGDALFTSASAVCVTGLVITDTASFWSSFGQAVILVLIQIGGLSIVLVTTFFATISGKKISLLQRSMLQDSISSHQIGGVVKMTIIIISARSEDSDKIEALDAGADDYLTKPFSVEELLARLRVTLRRLSLMQNPSVDSSVYLNGRLKIDYAAGCAYLEEEELKLTPIEFKLLTVLAKNTGKVLTHTYITQNIWGRSWDNDVASLRVYMATLRKKLKISPDSPQYIQTHIGIGYRMLKVE